jgi:hypothetical protein
MDMMEFYRKQEIDVLFNLPYSPKFNGIESYFSNVKLFYKKFLLMKVTKNEKVDSEQLIEEAIQ